MKIIKLSIIFLLLSSSEAFLVAMEREKETELPRDDHSNEGNLTAQRDLYGALQEEVIDSNKVRDALERGADAESWGELEEELKKPHPLIFAIIMMSKRKANNLEALDVILKFSHADIINNQMALLPAVLFRNVEIYEFLVDRGASAEQLEIDDVTKELIKEFLSHLESCSLAVSESNITQVLGDDDEQKEVTEEILSHLENSRSLATRESNITQPEKRDLRSILSLMRNLHWDRFFVMLGLGSINYLAMISSLTVEGLVVNAFGCSLLSLLAVCCLLD